MKTICCALFLSCSIALSAQQNLQPGFDKAEYAELLRVSNRQGDTLGWDTLDPALAPRRYRMTYRSAEVGLKNRWDLWESTRPGDPIVVSIRGTTNDAVSWLANVYAAMSPAQGSMEFSDKFRFEYHLADNPAAAVHTGWLTGMAFLWRDIEPVLNKKHQGGARELLIIGHSQGGAIAYLLTSHLHYLQKSGKIPNGWRIKTYCSAAPKPGNLYYAYDYEQVTAGGWGFTVVNPLDWVPEAPLTVQTVNDFNRISPLSNIEQTIKKQKFPQKTVLKHVYKQLSNPALKANKRYQKYFGKKANKYVEKTLPDFREPEYVNTNNYMRAGCPVVLSPDEAYLNKYPNDPNSDNIFRHHLPEQYLFLLERLRY